MKLSNILIFTVGVFLLGLTSETHASASGGGGSYTSELAVAGEGPGSGPKKRIPDGEETDPSGSSAEILDSELNQAALKILDACKGDLNCAKDLLNGAASGPFDSN